MMPTLAVAVVAPVAVAVAVAFTAAGSGILDEQGTNLLMAGACAQDPVIPGDAVRPAGRSDAVRERIDAVQIANARIIDTTGISLKVPTRGRIVAIAAAMQESRLRNLDHGDAAGPDSRGLFQQRAAWGPSSARNAPAAAAAMFFTGGAAGQPGLLDIAGWQDLSLTAAAQAVQRSAHPNAYAQWEVLATRLVATFAASVMACTLDDGITIPGDLTSGLPAGYAVPPGTPRSAAAAIGWALAQLGTPYQWGGDCTAAHSGVPARRCDCSSLTQQAYKHAGVTLPRTTSEQITVGTPVYSLARLAPGDLVFLPGHVGMYLGYGRVVHAPKTGDVVKVSRLQGYWVSNMTAMRHVATR